MWTARQKDELVDLLTQDRIFALLVAATSRRARELATEITPLNSDVAAEDAANAVAGYIESFMAYGDTTHVRACFGKTRASITVLTVPCGDQNCCTR